MRSGNFVNGLRRALEKVDIICDFLLPAVLATTFAIIVYFWYLKK